MADVKNIDFKLSIKGVEQATTAISAMASKITRMQHMFNEISAAIIDLENDLNNITIEAVPANNSKMEGE